ncbi:hypothetical protein BDW72DRAFT_108579 [Aspergillus terricola var. indicus]
MADAAEQRSLCYTGSDGYTLFFPLDSVINRSRRGNEDQKLQPNKEHRYPKRHTSLMISPKCHRIFRPHGVLGSIERGPGYSVKVDDYASPVLPDPQSTSAHKCCNQQLDLSLPEYTCHSLTDLHNKIQLCYNLRGAVLTRPLNLHISYTVGWEL